MSYPYTCFNWLNSTTIGLIVGCQYEASTILHVWPVIRSTTSSNFKSTSTKGGCFWTPKKLNGNVFYLGLKIFTGAVSGVIQFFQYLNQVDIFANIWYASWPSTIALVVAAISCKYNLAIPGINADSFTHSLFLQGFLQNNRGIKNWFPKCFFFVFVGCVARGKYFSSCVKRRQNGWKIISKFRLFRKIV